MIIGYIANKTSTKFGFEPVWAKAFATAWDCGLNTESKLHRGIKVIVKYKDDKEQYFCGLVKCFGAHLLLARKNKFSILPSCLSW